MDESTPEPLLIPDPAPEEIKVTDGAPASYEAAVERLEGIIDRLDSGQAGLRETLDLCTEGKELVDYCAGELDAVGEGLKELNLDDLAARLDSSASS
jgi:exodeoxyribonuclease VII small subunit